MFKNGVANIRYSLGEQKRSKCKAYRMLCVHSPRVCSINKAYNITSMYPGQYYPSRRRGGARGANEIEKCVGAERSRETLSSFNTPSGYRYLFSIYEFNGQDFINLNKFSQTYVFVVLKKQSVLVIFPNSS